MQTDEDANRDLVALHDVLVDLIHQLEGVGIAIPGVDEGQWVGTEGLSFAAVYTVLDRYGRHRPDLTESANQL